MVIPLAGLVFTAAGYIQAVLAGRVSDNLVVIPAVLLVADLAGG